VKNNRILAEISAKINQFVEPILPAN